MEVNLVVEGLKFMLLGMGTVFVFLALMIVCMNIMSRIIQKYFPEPQASTSDNEGTVSQQSKKIAAITAAVLHHKKAKE